MVQFKACSVSLRIQPYNSWSVSNKGKKIISDVTLSTVISFLVMFAVQPAEEKKRIVRNDVAINRHTTRFHVIEGNFKMSLEWR